MLQEPSTLRSRQVIFRMELSNLEDGIVDAPVQLRKILEDGCHSIHTVPGGFDDQDGHEKCTRSRLFLDIFAFHRPLTKHFFHISSSINLNSSKPDDSEAS